MKNHNEYIIAVIGLGYVGLPLAIEFSKYISVIGFDINKEKIEYYKSNIDTTNEVGDRAIKECTVKFTYNEYDLDEANFFIVAVPTPINKDKTPDLNPIIEASKLVGRHMKTGDIVVYESTVYPGLTEELCVPFLEYTSKLRYKEEFKIGYSPERINPSDKANNLTTIMKIVSGSDDESLEIIASIYKKIIKAGVYKVSNIKIAEAAKIIENSQRDVNIAFMNEMSVILNSMGIDLKTVLEACNTKWNFLDFKPGLVGGNCIGVDPYYLIYKADDFGIDSRILKASRQVNEDIALYIAQNTIKLLIKEGKVVKYSNIGIFGITFKENCADISNSKVVSIIEELRKYDVNIKVYDPYVKETILYDDIELTKIDDMKNFDVVIFAVSHSEFEKRFDLYNLQQLYKDSSKVLIDIKGIFNKNEAKDNGYVYWRL